jgi:hypothetical protein
MTQDELLEMARDTANHGTHASGEISYTFYLEQLEAFAKLVAAKEREECADLLEFGYVDDENHHLQYAYEIRARGEQA